MDSWAETIRNEKRERAEQKEAGRRAKEEKTEKKRSAGRKQDQKEEEPLKKAQAEKTSAKDAQSRREHAIDEEKEKKKEKGRQIEKYVRDFKAPSVTAPPLPKGKGKDNETAEGEGGKMLKPPERRISGIQEESIEKGETILSDWETFTERDIYI